MAIDEARRHALGEGARQLMGQEEGATLMGMLPPVGWADVATKHDILVLKQDLLAVEGRLRLVISAETNRAINRLIFWLVPLLLAYGAALVGLR